MTTKNKYELLNELDEIFDELSNIYGLNLGMYEKLCEGQIFEKETIGEVLNYFLMKSDSVKVRFLSYVLNTYYKGYIEVLFKTYLDDEKFELCSIFSKVKDTIEYPGKI